MSTSSAQETLTYGFYIRPKNYCRVLQQQLHEELLLMPNIDYYLPWDKDNVLITPEKDRNVTGEYIGIEPSYLEQTETLKWLKIAERAFNFWDNEIDDGWNNL